MEKRVHNILDMECIIALIKKGLSMEDVISRIMAMQVTDVSKLMLCFRAGAFWVTWHTSNGTVDLEVPNLREERLIFFVIGVSLSTVFWAIIYAVTLWIG